jgi:hypothetical protein
MLVAYHDERTFAISSMRLRHQKTARRAKLSRGHINAGDIFPRSYMPSLTERRFPSQRLIPVTPATNGDDTLWCVAIRLLVFHRFEDSVDKHTACSIRDCAESSHPLLPFMT